MRIAGNLTVKDWTDLNIVLAENQREEHWVTAANFFEERIKTRYLIPIRSILDMKENNGEGFAVVNLQCSLIETIESFINGWVYNAKTDKEKELEYNTWYKNLLDKNNKLYFRNSTEIFISFFKNRQPFKSLGIDGRSFYQDVRCPLLHETQTKNNWRIKKCSSATRSYCESPISKIIYRDQFQDDIEKVIDNYKIALIKRINFEEISSEDLRTNYIAKFNHLCNQ